MARHECTYRPNIPEAIVETPPPRRLLHPADRRYLERTPLPIEIAMSHLGIKRARVGNLGPAEGTWWVR